MATYAIGDVQGCYAPLCRLLEKINYDPAADRLWFTGDLINRGPDSLKTLRFIHDLQPTVVLGNHDLHYLAVTLGAQSIAKKDTFDDLLNAEENDALAQWLSQQRLLHHDAALGFTLVHAGIPPQWSLAQAQTYAEELHDAMRAEDPTAFYQNLYGDQPDCWDESLTGTARLRCITNYFTRMRFCDHAGRLDLRSKSGLDSAPPGFMPWFAHPERKMKSQSIVFGHWAALQGQVDHPHVFAVDGGCVWGGKLIALRLEDLVRFSV